MPSKKELPQNWRSHQSDIDLKNEGYLKNEDDLKRKKTSKMMTTSIIGVDHKNEDNLKLRQTKPQTKIPE